MEFGVFNCLFIIDYVVFSANFVRVHYFGCLDLSSYQDCYRFLKGYMPQRPAEAFMLVIGYSFFIYLFRIIVQFFLPIIFNISFSLLEISPYTNGIAR